MWMKWLPWRFIVRYTARKSGFLNPLDILSRLQQFSQPSEVAAPIELLRSGAVMHARGLINSQAIQHNLDWVWPFWVECQFDPRSESFIPRSFSITHINLTHRNWTAVGVPDCESLPIIDPRGLVTPFHDGWSIDAWIISENKKSKNLIPSRLPMISQNVHFENDLNVTTEARGKKAFLISKVQVNEDGDSLACQIEIEGFTKLKNSWLVISLRPYNPEGISFIHDIGLLDNYKGWEVNNKYAIYWDTKPDQHAFSYYRHGDVFSQLPREDDLTNIKCKVGMATAAAQYILEADQNKKIVLRVPLKSSQILSKILFKDERKDPPLDRKTTSEKWKESLDGICRIEVPDKQFKFLYDAAIRTLILHSPHEVYPGPYTYKRFWFRDAAFILYAMLCVGFKDRAERTIDLFPSRQTSGGYFLSQEGEWDSNGEALWIIEKFSKMTRRKLRSHWKKPIEHGGRWIIRKKLKEDASALHSGLLPSGFSAEHLGPNDYYYWDDFWGVAGLKAAGYLTDLCSDKEHAQKFYMAAEDLMRDIEVSLSKVHKRLGNYVIPASPYRRMDAGAIGSIVASYPLKLMRTNDLRIKNTNEFLIKNCFEHGGFFQDMTHSGINPYLTLHIAQVLLRSGDDRYFDLIKAVSDLSSSTGQWPEAIHPHTKGGCMGDGQHVWAAAEWVMMLRNCFVREEEKERRLILCSGIPKKWLEKNQIMYFGPTHTVFGEVTITIEPNKDMVTVHWDGKWFDEAPQVEVSFPSLDTIVTEPHQHSVKLKYGMAT